MLPRHVVVASLLSLPICSISAQQGSDILGSEPSRLTPVNVTATRVQYRGRDAVRIVAQRGAAPATPGTAPNTIAIIRDSDFRDGIIEADIAGFPSVDADTSARGFVRIAFRVDSSGGR